MTLATHRLPIQFSDAIRACSGSRYEFVRDAMDSFSSSRLPTRERLARLVSDAQALMDSAGRFEAAEPAANTLASEIRPFLHAYFARTVGPDLADDLAQIALWKVIEGLRKGRVVPERAGGLVRTIAKNLAKDQYRSDRRRPAEMSADELDELPIMGDPDLDFREREIARALLATCDDCLDPRERLVIQLMTLGYSNDEIAERLDVDQSTLWRWKSRMRATLWRALSAHLTEQPRDGADSRAETRPIARTSVGNDG